MFHAASRAIGIYVFPRFQLPDLSGPLAALQTANGAASATLYQSVILSRLGGPVPTSAPLVVSTTSARPRVRALDTLVVVGGDEVRGADDVDVDAIRMLASRARQVARVCTGALLLAAAGLLDARRRTGATPPGCNAIIRPYGSKPIGSTSTTGTSGPRPASAPASTWRSR